MRWSLLCLLLASCTHLTQKSSEWSDVFPGYQRKIQHNLADPNSEHLVDANGRHVFIAVLASDLKASEKSRYFEGRRNYLQSLFQNDEDPYFSRTNRIDTCIRQLNLEGTRQVGNGWESLAFQLPATTEFVLGQCNDALESHQSEITYLYCERKKTVLELKAFQPKGLLNPVTLDPEKICANI